MRDAIIFSTGTWETFNVQERIALALRQLGARVLICAPPVSIFRGHTQALREVEQGILAFQPVFFSMRATAAPVFGEFQAGYVAQQILDRAEHAELQNPVFFYPWMDKLLPVCAAMKEKFPLVHVQLDYGEPDAEHHVRLSDLTLVIQRTVYEQQRAKFGTKIQMIPQAVSLEHFRAQRTDVVTAPEMAAIPHPRLGYMGPAGEQVNRGILYEILRRHPEWNFVSIGSEKALPLPNVHVLPWCANSRLPQYSAGLDVGFLPYDCYREDKLHCTPLKAFEYFALGLPVVATPVIELWPYDNEIYFGNSADELEHAIQAAIAEPLDSPKRSARLAIANEHSIERLAQSLAGVLPLTNGGKPH